MQSKGGSQNHVQAPERGTYDKQYHPETTYYEQSARQTSLDQVCGTRVTKSLSLEAPCVIDTEGRLARRRTATDQRTDLQQA